MSKKIRKQPIDAYFRDLPGRWRPAPKGKKSDNLLEPWILKHGLALEVASGHKLVCWCDVCGVVVAQADDKRMIGSTDGNVWEWSDPVDFGDLDSELGDHRRFSQIPLLS